MTAKAPSRPGPPTIVVVMGVSGSGKTTVGEALATRLGWAFQEGDDLHPPANVAKMASGAPLDDADRGPWLEKVEAWVSQQLAAGRSGVIACSALKRAYRDAIAGGRDDVVFVYLQGSEDLIAQRLRGRRGHFMPPALLPSQFATLQPPDAAEDAIVVTIDQPVEAQVAHILGALAARRGGTAA